MEDHAVGDGGKAAQLVEGSQHVQVGGSPGIAAAARIAGLGDPHLSAGDVLVPQRRIGPGIFMRNGQVCVGVGLAAVPVTLGHHGGQALGHAVVIMVAEHVHGHGCSAHQVVGGDHLHHAADARSRAFRVHAAHRAVAQRTRPYAQAIRVVLLHPAKENILVAGIIGCGIARRCAGHGQHVGFVHELRRVDLHAVLMAESEDLAGLGQVEGAAVEVIARAVADGDQQLAAHRPDKVQHTDPLRPGQHAGITRRGLAAGGVVKVIIGLRRPGAGHADPRRAELPRQLPQLFVVEVDRRVILHQVGHGGEVRQRAGYGEFLRPGDLPGGVGLPEGAAGHLGHFNVIGNQPLVHLAEGLQIDGVQLNRLCHAASAFLPSLTC